MVEINNEINTPVPQFGIIEIDSFSSPCTGWITQLRTIAFRKYAYVCLKNRNFRMYTEFESCNFLNVRMYIFKTQLYIAE